MKYNMTRLRHPALLLNPQACARAPRASEAMAATQRELDILTYIAAREQSETRGSWDNHATLPGPRPNNATMACLARALGAAPGNWHAAETASVATSSGNHGTPPARSQSLAAALDVHGLPNDRPTSAGVSGLDNGLPNGRPTSVAYEDPWANTLPESSHSNKSLEFGEALPEGGEEILGFVRQVASRPHPGRKCKPCAFYHTTGCTSGGACQFCHECTQRRKKQKKRLGRRERVARKDLEQGSPRGQHRISL